jgi:protein subunit release factor A
MVIPDKDLKIEITEDRPNGMHTSPNPYWITITHIPSMACVRAYSGEARSQNKVKEAALLCLEMLVDYCGGECGYPERLKP